MAPFIGAKLLLLPEGVLLEHRLTDDSGQQGDHAEAPEDDEPNQEHQHDRPLEHDVLVLSREQGFGFKSYTRGSVSVHSLPVTLSNSVYRFAVISKHGSIVNK